MKRFAAEVSKLSRERLALLCVELQRELEARRQSRAEPIAVLGIGCRLPGGVQGPDDFWRLLEQGVDAIGPIPEDRWDVGAHYDPARTTPGKMYTRQGGFLDRVDEFDPEFFGISPREARHMDPQQRLLLEVAWEALEHAGQVVERLAGSRTGVFMGIGAYDYAMWQGQHVRHESINAYTGTGNAFCFASGRLSYLLGLHGPSLALDTACATSLVALHLACQSLRADECNLALAGGVNLMLAPEPTIFLSQAQALASDGRCKTFDASADGYGRSEGCGVVVLKRLTDAIAARDPVLAVIRGSAVNHDGRSAGLTVPNGAAQQAVIRAALAQAGVAPHEIDYVEAHGTGTVLGDPIEVRALAGALGGDPRRTRPLWIGAAKANIGHCEVAAGMAGLAKVVLALQHRTIPPQIHQRQTNPHIVFDEIPARVPQACVAWPDQGGPRVAGLNAFGLSGTNAHVVIEEFRAPDEAGADDADAARGPHVLTLSARDPWSLSALASAWREALGAGGLLDGRSLRDLCYTASARRSHHRQRWAAVVHDPADAARKLGPLAAAGGAGARGVGREPRLAFVFSGQGAQWWAMGRELAAREPVFRQALDECLGLLRALGDEAVTRAFGDDEAVSRLADTEVAQPALFVLQVALTRLLASWGVRPDAVIGHSAGELAAVHVGGGLGLEDAARLALHRGRVMQRATGQGRMAAVRLTAADAAALAASFDGRLALAAVNGPASSVLSGEAEALTEALAQLTARGVWHRLLPVNYAFHSGQMQALRGALLEGLPDLRPQRPELSIVSTVSGQEVRGADFDAEYWCRNLTQPVLFADGVAALIAGGHNVFLEIGPQPVLGNAMVECLEGAGRRGAVLASLRRTAEERRALLESLATLYTLGVGVEWSALYRGQPQCVPLPRYPWHRRRLWLSADHDPTRAAAAPPAAPAAVVDEAPEARLARVQGYLHALRWEAVERAASRQVATAANWLICADRGGSAAALARALEAEGAACDLVFAAADASAEREDSVDPTSARALADVLRARQAARGPYTGILYLWGLDAESEPSVSQRLVGEGLLSVIQAASLAGWSGRQLWIVTRGCQTTGPDAPAPAASQAPLWGMARTIPLELPGLACVALDLDPAAPADATGDLAAEIVGWDGADQVAFRGGRRYLPRIHGAAPSTPPDGGQPRFACEATYLITGGTGALGLELARFMVQGGARHLVLVARGAPSAEAAGVLDELRAAGADVRLAAADVARRDDVARLLADIERAGPPLKGLVHAAGVVDVGFLERQPRERFAAVFPAKVEGAWNLHLLTRAQPLDFFVMFSSTASVFGSLGQANYAGANAYLDALAYLRRAQGLPALTINWGPWGDVGMAARLGEQVRQRWALQGVSMLSNSDGLLALSLALDSTVPQVAAIAIDWPAFLANHPQLERTVLFASMAAAAAPREGAGGAPRHAEFRRRLDQADPEEAAGLVQEFVQQQFADAMGFESAEALDPQRGFLEMGVDSLMATRVMLALNEALQLQLPLSLMFEHPTIAALTAEVERLRVGGSQAARAAARPRGTRIVHVDTREPAPLSPVQQGLWFVSRFEADEPAYNEALLLRLTGTLEPAVLARALGEIVRRHETLRTVFRQDEDGPVQVAQLPAPVDLPVEVCGGPEACAAERLQARLTEEVRTRFDLARGPLLRARLLRLRPDEHVLVLVTHHLLIDGWSYGVLAGELAVLCEAYASGTPSPLPELPIQYADFARWQQRRLTGGELDGQLAYWLEQVSGVPALAWPGVTRAARTFAGSLRTFEISRSDEQGLAALGRSEGATLFMTLLATYLVWLYRHTGQTDFAVGLPVGGRPREAEALIGPLMNVLPYRARLDGRQSFRRFLARVRQAALEAFEHQDLPFIHLVQKLGLRRDRRLAPVFQVLFAVENAPFPEVALRGLRMEPIRVDFGVSKFDLSLIFEQREGRLDGFVEYNTALFDEGLMTAMIGHYQELLASLLADAERPLDELPLLPAAEREQVLVGWNPGAAARAACVTALERFERQARLAPAAVAVVSAGRTLTYAELERRANQLAAVLRQEGVTLESPVAVCLERGLDLIVALLAVWKAGAAYVPLDPQAPAARLVFTLRDARARLALTTTALADPLLEAGVPLLDLEREAPRLAAAPAATPAAGLGAAHLAYVIYTSGSTGQPKGVGVTHDNVAGLLDAGQALFDFTPADTWTCFHSAAFDFSVWEIWAALASGGRLVVVPHETARRPEAFAALLRDERVTVLNQTPSAFRALQGQDSAGWALRLVIFGGEALAFDSLGPWVERHGLDRPRLVNMYGITETTVHVTHYATGADDLRAGRGSRIGRALPGWCVYLLDEQQQPAPVGVPAEIYVGGAGVARGYLGRPDLTAARFVPDPFGAQPGARLYRSGDLGRWLPEGVCEYLGRADQQVKLRGYRIEPGEIESALRRQPEVGDAVVVLREDEPDARRLVAYLAPAPGAQVPSADVLQRRLRLDLPDYMVPAAFVALAALPLTANGKVDRRALPAPAGERPDLSATYVAPRTELEQTLARAWAEVLGLQQVGVHDNFFDLGGASLSALAIMEKLSAAGVPMQVIDPLQVFEYQTVAELAQALLGGEAEPVLAPSPEGAAHA